MTVADRDKEEAARLAKGFIDLGYHIQATGGTGKYFEEHGIPCVIVNKIHEGQNNCADLIRRGEVDLMLNTLLTANALNAKASSFVVWPLKWAPLA